MNPLNPHNILPAHTDEARRAHERNVAQPWSLVVACGVVAAVFGWGIVGAVVSGYWVPEKEIPRAIVFSCPAGPILPPQKTEKVICFRPPPPPRTHTIRYTIPKPVKREPVYLKHKELTWEEEINPQECTYCDAYQHPPSVPKIELPSIEDPSETGCYGAGIEEESYEMIELKCREPNVIGCGFADQIPQAINLSEIQDKVQYLTYRQQPQGPVVFRIQVDRLGRYNKHEVSSEADPLLVAAIESHLSTLRFTPAIQGGKPVSCWVTIPFRFEWI